jgi:hypothetical protein
VRVEAAEGIKRYSYYEDFLGSGHVIIARGEFFREMEKLKDRI